jgi:hypothetical protein
MRVAIPEFSLGQIEKVQWLKVAITLEIGATFVGYFFLKAEEKNEKRK